MKKTLVAWINEGKKWQTSIPIHDKNYPKNRNIWELPQNPTDYISFNSKILYAFTLRLRTKQGCPLSPLLWNITLEVLAYEVKEGKEIKDTKIQKEKIKLFHL